MKDEPRLFILWKRNLFSENLEFKVCVYYGSGRMKMTSLLSKSALKC